ncbi:N-acetylmuramoyl-L-alanine amidase [Cystobacter fuscus]
MIEPMSTTATAISPSSAAPTSSSLPEGELREGEQGPEVQRLQTVLVRLKYLSARADGDFGPKTKAALQAFQSDWRLTADGVYGPGTRAALLKALVPVYKPKVVSKPSPQPRAAPGHGHRRHPPAPHRHQPRQRGPATLRKGSGPNRVSAHYLVAPGGTLYQLVQDSRAAWHAGVSSLFGETSPSVNLRSIGIELTNDGSGTTPFTEEQYRVLEQLVPYRPARTGCPSRTSSATATWPRAARRTPPTTSTGPVCAAPWTPSSDAPPGRMLLRPLLPRGRPLVPAQSDGS